jgi:hypothetical protein
MHWSFCSLLWGALMGEVVFSSANRVWTIFLSLPIATQWAVTILLVLGVIVHLFNFNERTVHDGPSIFTTGGIFFTFLGIAEGLYGFDPKQLELSVPALLDGLKTAFIASVVGVGIALTIKLRYTLFGVRQSKTQTKAENTTVDDLYNQMVAVQQSLVGEDDSTLLSQIKLSRQDSNDRLDALRKSQSDFMQKMAENNSKALIQALQELIRDFNIKITEQFGENFKQERGCRQAACVAGKLSAAIVRFDKTANEHCRKHEIGNRQIQHRCEQGGGLRHYRVSVIGRAYRPRNSAKATRRLPPIARSAVHVRIGKSSANSEQDSTAYRADDVWR